MFYKILQNTSYLMFVIGAAGVEGKDMIRSALICFAGLLVLGITTLLERKQYDKASINSKRCSRDLQRVRKHGVQNHKAA